jgi:hypothetical protein
MSVDSLHTLYAVTYGAGPTTISGIQSSSVSTGLQDLVQSGDGAIDASFVSIFAADPMINFSTVCIAKAITAAGTTGACITTNPLKTFWQATTCTARASSTSHLLLTINEGFIVPRTLSCSIGSPATMSMQVIASYNGSNDSIIWTDSQALVGTVALDELYGMGELSVTSTAVNGGVAYPIPGLQSVDIDFGVNLYVQRGDNDISPTYIAVRERRPVITATFLNAKPFAATVTAMLSGGATTAMSVKFWKKTAGGANSANYLTVSGTTGKITLESQSSANAEGVMSTVKLIPLVALSSATG